MPSDDLQGKLEQIDDDLSEHEQAIEVLRRQLQATREEFQDDLKIVLKFIPTNIVELARLEANKTPPSQWSGSSS